MNNLLRLIGRRLVALPIMALGVTVLVFFLMSFSKTDPAYTALGDGASPEAVAEYHEKYGLDDPWPVRYVRYMGDLIHGDMGTYGAARNSVAKRISTALPVTMQLTFIGLAIGAVVSFLLGVRDWRAGNAQVLRRADYGQESVFRFARSWAQAGVGEAAHCALYARGARSEHFVYDFLHFANFRGVLCGALQFFKFRLFAGYDFVVIFGDFLFERGAVRLRRAFAVGGDERLCFGVELRTLLFDCRAELVQFRFGVDG